MKFLKEVFMYDLIIIGSGPAGLSAAVYAKRAGLNMIIIEKNPVREDRSSTLMKLITILESLGLTALIWL